MRRARAAVAIVVCALGGGFTGACMPWIAPPGARVAQPGRVELGTGVAVLLAPDEPDEPVPVPQAWLRVGVLRRVDAGLSYAAPMTGIVDVRWQLVDRAATSVATGIGAGVHAFPDLGGLGEAIALPVGTAYAAAELTRHARSHYGFVRAWVPAYLDSEPHAAVVWGQLGAGVEWHGRRIAQGPQLGFVLPSTGIRDAVLIGSWAVRWR